jgi:hypothetical protein
MVYLLCDLRDELVPRTEPFNRLRGFTAGPCTTAPSEEKRDPWQGQSQVFSALFQLTMQPRWVQRADSE